MDRQDGGMSLSHRLKMSAEAARLLMVAAQSLAVRARRRADKAAVLEAIRAMGALQIDTIHVVARSPYLVLWSRLGTFDPVWLEQLLAEGKLFEYWSHEACFLPIEDYPLYRHRMLNPGAGMGWKYSEQWVAENAAVLQRVLEQVRAGGPVRSADFERLDGKGGGWWGWKPEKRALEMMFTRGDLMVARRERFQRVYDLRERVLPGWDDSQLGPVAETNRVLVEKAARALGIATARWLADYFRMSRHDVNESVRSLHKAGTLVEAVVPEWREPAFVHSAHLALAEQAIDGGIRPTRTTLLSPFDPLVWDRARARTVFNFDYSLECYTPAPKRRYGYFVLPVLRRGRLVARLDAKAHRVLRQFEVKAFYLEDGVRPGTALLADIGRAISEIAAWHGTPEVRIRKTVPRELAGELRRVVAGEAR
jgi:uncharacterized protein YcaQ